jgi:hypothetical protein
MVVKTTRVDLIKTRAAWPEEAFQPAFVFPRKDDTRKWLVLDAPISENAALTWASAASDEYVRIPLFKYDLPAQGDTALAIAFRLGLSCAAQLASAPECLHIVTGNPVELVSNSAGAVTVMRYWFGFAIAFD